MPKRFLVTMLSKSLTKSVLTASANQRRESRFLPKRSPLLRSLEDRLRLTDFESCRKTIVDFRESSLLAAALNSVRPIYGNGTDLLAYFSVHSNPYAAIVAEFSASVETELGCGRSYFPFPVRLVPLGIAAFFSTQTTPSRIMP